MRAYGAPLLGLIFDMLSGSLRPLERGRPCSAISARAASRSSGVFRASVCTPGSARLARPVSVPPGHTSMSAVDAELLEGLHAQVPADRVGDLADQPRDDLGAGGDGPAVRVRHVRDRRVGGRQARGGLRQRRDRGGHVVRCGTRRRPSAATTRRTPSGLSASSAASCSSGARGDDLARAVHVRRGQAQLLQVRRRSTSGSPPSSADMPVSVTAAASAIARPRLRTSVSAAVSSRARRRTRRR